MNVLLTLNPGIGEDLGPNFLITSDVEGWSDTATDVELYAGVEVTVPDEATVVYIQSLGLCFNILTLPIEETTTTTSSTSTTTTSTTEVPETTTTTTTYVEVPCEEGYGLLYNWYATQGTGSASITSSDDWVVPADVDYQTLADYLGASGDYTTNAVGGKLKQTGFDYWDSPNTGATNEVGFNAVGNGYRTATSGTFTNIKVVSILITSSTASNTVFNKYAQLYNNASLFLIDQSGIRKKTGQSIRLLYTGTGTPTSYTGNDGKVYRVVTIGTQTWLVDNLQETKFRNGDIIPYHGSNNGNNFTNAEWAALTTAGVCAYDNDVANVGCDFVFPEEETTTTTTTTEG